MEQISKYFTAEKNESIVFILTGIIAVMLSLYFLLKTRQPFYNGLAYAITAIALIHLTIGTTIWIRSPKDIDRVENIIKKEPGKIQSEEIPRMETVLKNFVIYRYIEIVLLIAGLILFFTFQPGSIWKGAGLGLVLQSLITLFLDYLAEARGKEYLDFLQSLLQK